MTGVPAMERADSPLRDGLEGVVVAETLLSEVDGERGRLIIAGFDVEQLALNHGFEHAVSLLWRASEALREDEVQSALGQGRVRAFERLSRLGDALELEQAMDALRAGLAHLPESASAADLV